MDDPIIDCHTHIYPAKIAVKAARFIGDFYGVSARWDGTVDTLLAQCREAGIGRCLALAVAVDADHVTRINDFLIENVSAHADALWGFATLHPDMADPGAEVERILKAGMKGVKLHPDMQRFSLAEARTDRLFAACAGVCPVMIHAGDVRYHNSNPSLIPPVLKKHPDLTLICAHFGGYGEWDDAEKLLADTGVYVDTSSTSFRVPAERVKEMILLFGEDRVLFGTDYPMWTAKQEIDLLLSLGLPDRTMRKIFRENALRLLG